MIGLWVIGHCTLINRIFHKIFIRHKLVISSDTLSRSEQSVLCRCLRALDNCLPTSDSWTGSLIRVLMLVSNEVCLCHWLIKSVFCEALRR